MPGRLAEGGRMLETWCCRSTTSTQSAGPRGSPTPWSRRTTSRPGPDPGTCYAGPPAYHKVPALSVLFSMFLHAGWLHLLGNMLFLVIFGNNIEDRFGRIRYLLFYVAAGFVAAYGFAFANHNSTEALIGASGAIAGVLGAYLVIYPRVKVWSLVPFLFFIPVRTPAWLVLGMWFVLQWVYAAANNGQSAASGAGLLFRLARSG